MTKRPADDGAIAILVALLSVVLFGFGALVVDIGDAQTVRSQSQNAVDAAALAGVRVLAAAGTPAPVGTPAAVADAVKKYVSDNIGATDWAGCTDPTPLAVLADTDTSDSCISISAPIGPGVPSYQVRVKLPARHVPATFGGLFGVSSISISPVAQALSGQPLPPECGPCAPALDESTGQPKLPSPSPQFPCRGTPSTQPPCSSAPELPDPGNVPPAAPLNPLLGNCPTPGLFSADVLVLSTFHCTLKPGLYVFTNNARLDVPADASIASFLSDGSDGLPMNAGVTLVFYDSATITVEGMIGTPVGSVGPPTLIAGDPTLAATWTAGQPIPGVAIVFDQFDPNTVSPPRTFTLGDRFGIKGSVYALDGHTTWATVNGDCPAVGSTCSVYDFPNTPSVIATTTTAFAETPSRIPMISTEHPPPVLPPLPPHLTK
ncbi:MAG TPA: pilus assembly protein TadG-related protein [Acidothermaceae bacterium]